MVLETEVCFPGVPVTEGVSFLSCPLTRRYLCMHKPVCVGTSANLSIYNQLHMR